MSAITESNLRRLLDELETRIRTVRHLLSSPSNENGYSKIVGRDQAIIDYLYDVKWACQDAAEAADKFIKQGKLLEAKS